MLEARLQYDRLEAGCDEVGRGCLAGPVTAAAVILPADFQHEDLIDSKKLSEPKRLNMRTLIEENAIAWAVDFVSPVEIDRINILRASFLAMENAVNQLKVTPEFLLIDGNRFYTTLDIPHECIVKGDAKNASIAAASILAKTYRDEYMQRIHSELPFYGWNTNVGYPTKAHRDGIRKHGATKYHRKSFQLLPPQLEIEFGN